MKLLREFISYIIIIIVVILIRSFIVSPAQVIGASMEPTLKNKEIILLDKFTYHTRTIQRFDIVIVKMADNKALIKRVIGLPGEKLVYLNNNLYINDKLIKEPNIIKGPTNDFILDKEIPDNKYFIVGDNRNNTIDSRIFGVVDCKDILGTTNFIIYPFSKFGKVK